MLELYQVEGCPNCQAVRETLSELGLDFVVRAVPVEHARRDRVREISGQTLVPVLVDTERHLVIHEPREIVAYLREHYTGKH
ncbi:MAG TPA: glutathione S-transferase N-terminal domain-containing protein [Candidatus Polarisedimenticolia bacterium]|nr:glutathione S-transferase N-terminal domain-containing protein [Candidatus Polarisedimenticolia bacterium]